MATFYNYVEYKPGAPLEYIGSHEASLDPLETELQGEDVFLLPSNATWIEPPVAGENEKACFDPDLESWSLVDDYRGVVYYETDGTEVTIEDLDVTVPAECTTTPPTEGLLKPFWNGSAWEESGLVYMGKLVETKADVDALTKKAIADLDEEKAKTLKLIAGDGACPEWDAFVSDRNTLVTDGDQFIIDNSLS